jgi:hypothetical protein
MKFRGFAYVILASLAIAIGGRFLYIQNQSERREQLTHELCEIVGNYLETGALREAYEGFQQGLTRAG